MAILTLPLQTKNLGNGHYIQATAELNSDTVPDIASFHMIETCTNKVSGFTGGVQLFYYDSQAKLIGTSGAQQYGINQAPLFSAGHRAADWQGQAPLGTVSLGLALFADPHNRFPVLSDIGDAIGNFFTDIGTDLKDVGSAVAGFTKINPNITVGVLFVIIAGALIAAGGTVVLGAGGIGVVLDF